FVIARMDMIGRHIGEWLSTFHTATRVEDRKHDHDSYSFELSRLISRCHSFGLSASMLNGVERAALSLSESSRACLSPVAAMHGDFIPQNILVQKDITRVVDFASFCRQAPVYSDLARFVAYLMILGSKPFYCQSILESVTRHFFVG